MKKIEKMFQVGGKISGRSGYRKHNIFLLHLTLKTFTCFLGMIYSSNWGYLSRRKKNNLFISTFASARDAIFKLFNDLDTSCNLH